LSASQKQNQIVQVACEWIGTPYRHQASMRGVGTDCLGLIRGVFVQVEGHASEVPPAYSKDWADAPGPSGLVEETMADAARRHLVEIEKAKAAPGDVLLFRMSPRAAAKHAAIQSTPTCMIHACSGRAVAEVHMGPWWQRRLTHVFRFPGIEI